MSCAVCDFLSLCLYPKASRRAGRALPISFSIESPRNRLVPFHCLDLNPRTSKDQGLEYLPPTKFGFGPENVGFIYSQLEIAIFQNGIMISKTIGFLMGTQHFQTHPSVYSAAVAFFFVAGATIFTLILKCYYRSPECRECREWAKLIRVCLKIGYIPNEIAI